jgi:integrase
MNLTLPFLTAYNLHHIQTSGGLCMKGRVRTREKCPQCNKPFKIIEEMDIYCPACHTRPKTFFIFLYWDRKKFRISRDKDGHLLDSYKRAHRLLESIRKNIDDKIFSITDYLPGEIEQFRGNKLSNKWYDAKLSQNLSPGHLKKVKQYIEKYFSPFFNNLDCRQLRTYHIEDFLTQLPDYSTKTKKNIMIMLKNFCNWLFKRETLLRMPQFPTLSPSEPPIHWIDKEQQLQLLDAIPLNHRPIFEFLIYHPIRPGEVRALKVKDVNIKDMTIHICRAWSLKSLRSRKNKKPYYLPLSQKFNLDILRDKLPEAFLFTNTFGNPYTDSRLRKIWKSACKNAGIKISLYHATRHSIASQAINQGVDLAVISQALGHCSTASTKRYASLKVQRLKSVIDGAQMVQIEDFAEAKSLINKGKSE